MKLKSFSIIAFFAIILTSCPYQSEYILGEKTNLDPDLIGTYVLDSSKFVVEKLVLEIDSNANYSLSTFSEENGEQNYQGTLVISTIGKTKIFNFKSDINSQYQYFKYNAKTKALYLQFLSQNKFEIREPNSKAQLDSIYTSNSKKNIWAFNMKLKRKL